VNRLIEFWRGCREDPNDSVRRFAFSDFLEENDWLELASLLRGSLGRFAVLFVDDFEQLIKSVRRNDDY
jgi:hypothetical protein